MSSQQHEILQLSYYVSFILALLGASLTIYFSATAINSSVTQPFEDLQWGTSILPVFLAGLPSFAICMLNFKLEDMLKQLGAHNDLLLIYGRKILIGLFVFAGICFGASIAIANIRLDLLKK